MNNKCVDRILVYIERKFEVINKNNHKKEYIMYNFKIKIADVVILTKVNYPDTKEFFASFLSDEKVDEEICIEVSDIIKYHELSPDFTEEMCERAALKYKVDRIAVEYGAFPFHASALSYKGEGYVFTALSGVGKSTHARIWRDTYGKDVIMINDDRPYLKVVGDSVYAYSHPQSGKHNIYTNSSCQVKVIGKIIRDERNYVKRISKSDIFPFLVQQTFTMDEPGITSKIIELIKKVLDRVFLYEIHCNMNLDAALSINEQIQLDINRK